MDKPSNKPISAREKILFASLDLFTHKGFQVTTTQEIANKAEVNQVTLFRHFATKQKLLQAVLEEFLVPKLIFNFAEDQLFEKYKDNPKGFFKALASTVAKSVKSMLPFMKMQILEAASSSVDDEILNTLSQLPIQSRKKLEAILKKCEQKGWIQKRQTYDPLIVSLYGPFFAYFMNVSKFQSRVFKQPEELMIEEISNNFVKVCF